MNTMHLVLFSVVSIHEIAYSPKYFNVNSIMKTWSRKVQSFHKVHIVYLRINMSNPVSDSLLILKLTMPRPHALNWKLAYLRRNLYRACLKDDISNFPWQGPVTAKVRRERSVKAHSPGTRSKPFHFMLVGFRPSLLTGWQRGFEVTASKQCEHDPGPDVQILNTFS